MSKIQTINLKKVELKFSDTEDPVAQRTSWEPANRGGANFKAQQMIEENQKIIIKKSVGAIIFYLVFAIPGALAVVILAPYLFISGEIVPGIFAIVWGAIFGGAGFLMLLGDKNMTFDKAKGVYFRGQPRNEMITEDKSVQGSLKDIYAIQLISERIRSTSSQGGSSTYTSYELNLVLRDGSRVNVMDHGKEVAIDDAAKALAKFLNVPVWKGQF
ncbi:hypothetical protein [Aliikangiella maris]|uniref:Uncharacterized protein n=2 Tax=Aliikangiella maris TaxID=3162458 RepID=A0ABV3MVF6_9GAMM